MITSSDSACCVDLDDYYAILPSDGVVLENYKAKKKEFKNVEKGFSYNSGSNVNFLSVEQLRNLIKLHVDKNFKPI